MLTTGNLVKTLRYSAKTDAVSDWNDDNERNEQQRDRKSVV